MNQLRVSRNSTVESSMKRTYERDCLCSRCAKVLDYERDSVSNRNEINLRVNGCRVV